MNQQLPSDCATSIRVQVRPLNETSSSWLASVAEETPVAFRYNGLSHAVMMATPNDLGDFALGFSRSENIIADISDVGDMAIRQATDGITIDLTLLGGALHRYLAGRRVRLLRGHTSCGLCGVEDLSDIETQPQPLGPTLQLDPTAIASAIEALRDQQPLSRLTRCAHASAWVSVRGELLVVREDVGRHNSLDKLIGALLSVKPFADHGFCLITSRCSFEMVQKAAMAGFSSLVSVGAPTALAVGMADRVGLTLYGISRDGQALQFASPISPGDAVKDPQPIPEVEKSRRTVTEDGVTSSSGAFRDRPI